ncbi:MAG TPA: UDP-N-acetylmuramoyl-tripeptide--D-alanyl-D-alanine ligase [Candidatus Acidoferrales bacterium]|nr:UDP-N-acetylmuramoyl-tripeptide--D-alanyl-D-alanine ligase [Candidatus Acidoferrales bacterium]
MRWQKQEILSATGGKVLQEGERAVFGELVTDSRRARSGSVFLALKGERFDAHDFVPEAVARGARCLIVHKRPRARVPAAVTVIQVRDTLSALGALARHRRRLVAPKVLAITGSNGKTTTKEMVASILERTRLAGVSLKGKILKTQGNYNNLVGVPLTLLRLSGKERIAVLELGTSRPGEIRRLAEIAEPDVGLITVVAPAHLEGLKSVAGVAREKGALFGAIRPGGVAVVNVDDPWIRRAARSFPGRRVTFGRRGQVRAEKISMDDSGTSFTLRVGSIGRRARIGLPGRHNLTNALAAAAMAYAAGARLPEITAGLAAAHPVEMRMQVERWRGARVINDAYNANPGSMEAAVATLAAVAGKGPKIAVLGDMLELGKKARALHRELGEKVARYGIDRLYLLGAHAAQVRRGALAGGMAAERITVGRSHEEIARLLRPELRDGAWILVKGSRGTRMENVLASLKRVGA